MRVIGSDARLSPFGDAVGDLPLIGRTLARLREEEAALTDSARLTFAAHAFATTPILAAWLARVGPPGGRPRALAFAVSSPLAHLVPVSTARRVGELWVLDVFADAPIEATLEDLRAQAEPVAVEASGVTYRRELPRLGPAPHHLELPADGAVAAHVEHWVHLLWLGPLLVPRLRARAEGKRRRTRGAEQPSIVHPTAEIHPTARLDGAIVGPRAIVGVGCTIDHSYVGADARLADFSKVSRCVLGDGVHTLADANFSHVVSLGDGTLTNLQLRDVLIGRKVFLTSGVIFWGEALGATITVEHEGREHDTGRRLLGGCVGHGAVLGARTIVGPGRALPNRTVVVMRREEGVLRVAPHAPGTPLCWDDAALVPYAQLRPGETPDELGGRQ
jgi:carbonic anhydrase/acetyltransferase-like protein (isoleucine patch superfamily)